MLSLPEFLNTWVSGHERQKKRDQIAYSYCCSIYCFVVGFLFLNLFYIPCMIIRITILLKCCGFV